ncbi:unnamed protein product, partial [Heterotrigona itama]
IRDNYQKILLSTLSSAKDWTTYVDKMLRISKNIRILILPILILIQA